MSYGYGSLPLWDHLFCPQKMSAENLSAEDPGDPLEVHSRAVGIHKI